MSDFLECTNASIEKIRIDTEWYAEYLDVLEPKYWGVFSRSEIDRACRAILGHYPYSGQAIMESLLQDEKIVVRDFIQELGKLLDKDNK